MNINKMVEKVKNQVEVRYIFVGSRVLYHTKALRNQAFKGLKAYLVPPELKKQGQRDGESHRFIAGRVL